MRTLAFFIVALGALGVAAADETDTSDWYAFKASNGLPADSAVGMSDWNRGPAGRHGRIERRGDKLFYNGREIKLWGTNIGFGNSCPERAEAERIVAFYKKFGLNALRHHKHLDGPGWAGFQSERSFVTFDEAKLDRFDYFNHLLKEGGIYIEHSPTFHVTIGRDDLGRVPFHEEIGTMKDNPAARIRAGGGWVFLAEEIQDLQIEQTVNLLNHVNPYTKMRYADDPFLFCVELYNEDAVLFYSTNGKLQGSPTIRKRVAGQFAEWLKGKYQTEAAWRAAWGEGMVIADLTQITNTHLKNMVGPEHVKGACPAEGLDAGYVVPWFSPWFGDAAMDPDSEQAPLRQRLLDTMAFLITLQDNYYNRAIDAIRATGFKGEIVTSNWQSGSLVGHLLNLHSDARTGMVDRHNYFAGGGFAGLKPGNRFANASMLSQPGGGSLSVGLQQVEGAAFMVSEWTHEQPNEWYAEGPVTHAAYGWGLQGWDVSYHFLFGANTRASDRIGRGTWDANNPAILTTLPAVSRMVRRMDVDESPKTITLNAHVPSLLEGRMSFRGRTMQRRDQKVFATDKVPVEALAAVRVAVDFTDAYEDTPAFDLSPYLDGNTIVAANGQLRWTSVPGGDSHTGYYTINTRGTKGFVGFAPGGQTFDLGDGFAVEPDEGFCVILMTARDPDKTLLNDDAIVVTATARARNTGMELELGPNRNVVTKAGGPPLLMEPVRAKWTLPFKGTLDLLDHDGNGVTASRPFDKQLDINGAEDQTPYYLIRR